MDNTSPASFAPTYVSYQQSGVHQENAFNEYISRELINNPNFPKHSKGVEKHIGGSIFEIFENARVHGRCDAVFTCGRYYPSKNRKKLDMTIVDYGATFHFNVNEYHKLKKMNICYNAFEAIEWVIKSGNMTKTDITGGLGLSELFSFIEVNEGIAQIISADGMVRLKKGEYISKQLKWSFPGTIVNMEFNVDDNNVYYLKDEYSDLDISNIF